ncbi:MAG: hypothetical protein KatS3mg031_0133 [Chitinophagales bacterium]|nr:MAG: hypothetical protein KatS3mg031_0133 [Chitinophagales bacterium]
MATEKISVLYVDDEVHNLMAFKASYRKRYRVFTASSCKEGLQILEKENIPVILADQRMPKMSGVKFFEAVAQKYPDTMRILITGYSDIEAVIEAVNTAGIFRYLTKPWKEEDLTEAIEKAYEVYCETRKRKELIENLKRTNEQLEFMLREKLIS